MIGALVLAVFTLPSALNLPLANPGQTLEYAPVPGAGNSQSGANFAGLGVGSSVGPGSAPGLDGSIGALEGGALHPSQYQCVGSPPRQTEDPMSPPCVAFFSGDNGGATYQGVTAKEIRVLFYLNGNYQQLWGQKAEQEPTGYCDLAQVSQCPQSVYVRALSTWQTYYNRRYQTYGRYVHFFAYFNDVTGGSPPGTGTINAQQVRADAQDNFQRIHPFAVMNYSIYYASDYSAVMAQHGVLSFGGQALRTADFFRTYPGLIWAYPPDTDQLSSIFASYICTKLRPYPASFSGNSGDNGQPRKYGLIYTTNPSVPEITGMATMVRQRVQACGVTISDTAPYTGYSSQFQGSDSDAAVAMARFKGEKITTIIWPGGWDPHNPRAAANLQYFPEWITLDDGLFGSAAGGNVFFSESPRPRVVLITPLLRMGPNGVSTDCAYAARSVDASVPSDDMVVYCFAATGGTYDLWDDLRQLFTGIQVAGPRLTPQNVEAGFRAIPARPSGSPTISSCYYLPGNYTCVKDAQADHWDPQGQTNSATNNPPEPGCWRMIQGGARYRAGDWPAGDSGADQHPSDPCNPR